MKFGTSAKKFQVELEIIGLRLIWRNPCGRNEIRKMIKKTDEIYRDGRP
jgi:hypothetical protein